ncbi:tyrosine-type recombinase/integrase [Erythrobacter sp. MTPC3]|uniref:tyrosine-type recombinase/integrase n=1 Tax=Erythrobacter sp. MTPC3 TaxID=3056564 RepID=UPI0036F2AFC0
MRTRHKLNIRHVTALTNPGMHSDGGGLYLRIRSTGTRSWVFVSNVGGKRREWGLGSALDVSLAKARERADQFRQAIVDGQTPVGLRQQNKLSPTTVPTFGVFADEFIEDIAKGLSNAKHAKQWHSTIETYGAPILDLPINEVATKHMVDVLKPIWSTKTETAKRVRGRIERILDAAQVSGFPTGENPARFKGHLELLLPRHPRGAIKHHPALPYSKIPNFISKLRSMTGDAAIALELLIMTSSRTSEVIGAQWDEFSPRAAVWTIPASRMKAREEHQVPLSEAAMKLLKKHRKAGPKEGHVFRGRDGGKMSNMAMAQLLKRMQYDEITVHGFRSTFRDWAGEKTDFERETIEMALAHSIGSKAEQAYRRARALEKRRELMEVWAAFLLAKRVGK